MQITFKLKTTYHSGKTSEKITNTCIVNQIQTLLKLQIVLIYFHLFQILPLVIDKERYVSFKTRNLCTFLLCLFRSIISSLVNDYYLISFLFQSVSFKHMYQILYFIFHHYKLLSTPPTFFLCYSCTIRYWRFIYNLQELDQSKFFFISHLRYFLFIFFWIRTLIYFSLSVHFIIASLLIRLVLHFSGIFSQFSFYCIFFQFKPHKFSYNVTINHYYAIFNPTFPSSSSI